MVSDEDVWFGAKTSVFIVLDIHVDGVKISDSSSVGLWTILCNVKPFEYLFTIGLFEGIGKPKDVDKIMQELLVEYTDMIRY